MQIIIEQLGFMWWIDLCLNVKKKHIVITFQGMGLSENWGYPRNVNRWIWEYRICGQPT